jgi:DNA-binding MarR family transcriptional regulator
MTKPFEELAALNKLIHEPARLAIMTTLSGCQSAEFLFLQQMLGLTVGNLSSHLSKLEEAGMVQIEKQFVGKKPSTMVSLTPVGREAIQRHWQLLEQLQKSASEVDTQVPGIQTNFKGMPS